MTPCDNLPPERSAIYSQRQNAALDRTVAIPRLVWIIVSLEQLQPRCRGPGDRIRVPRIGGCESSGSGSTIFRNSR